MIATLCAAWLVAAADPTVADPTVANAAGAGVVDAAVFERRTLRVAVYDLQLADLPPHWGLVVQQALVAELRKLQRTSVVGLDEIKAMLEHEANRQLAACDQGESCLGEIADALGVDVLVVGSLARVGDDHVIGLKRIDQREARTSASVNRTFAAGNGEEFLAVIGPAVAELFPEQPLYPGAVRGVAKEVALRLNPPPLAPWTFWTGLGLTSATLVATGVAAGANAAATADFEEYKANARPFVVATFDEKAAAVSGTAAAAIALGAAAATLALATGVAAFFTDFSSSTVLEEP